MHENGSDASDFRSLHGPLDCIPQHTRTYPLTLERQIDGQPTDDHDGHWIRHIATDIARRLGAHHRAVGKTVEADDAVPQAHDIGARAACALILDRALPEPII